MFCDEFHLVDLRVFDNCKKVATNVDHVFNLAADMGGMGFIQSNHSVIFYNNTMISFNMMEAARQTNVKRCDPQNIPQHLPDHLAHLLKDLSYILLRPLTHIMRFESPSCVISHLVRHGELSPICPSRSLVSQPTHHRPIHLV